MNCLKSIHEDCKIIKQLTEGLSIDVKVWADNTLDLFTKKLFTMSNIEVCCKLGLALHNMTKYYADRKEEDYCGEYIVLSMYLIGLQLGILYKGNIIECTSLFQELTSADDWDKCTLDNINALDFNICIQMLNSENPLEMCSFGYFTSICLY